MITGWIKYHQEAARRGDNETAADDQLFWTFKTMRDLCRIDPEAAWQVILGIVDRVENPQVLAYLGAGPLEDLLSKHGKDLIDRVEVEIQRMPRFAETAASVWQNLIPNDVWNRLQAALNRVERR